MAVFIETTTDPFDDNFDNLAANGLARGGGSGSRRTARRPTRGIEIKEDRPALLKVIRVDGREIQLFDSGGVSDGTGDKDPGLFGVSSGGGIGKTTNYTNFILQSVTEARMEKHQIVETFGQSYVFFFGEAPRFIDVSVQLINSHDFNWKAEWWANYDKYFRGTKLVEMGARLYMFYDDNIVEGYMIQCQAVDVADQPYIVQMNFRMFLTNYRNITSIGQTEFPVRGYTTQLASDNAQLRRTLISDNVDEYIGSPAGLTVTSETGAIQNQQEVEDLHTAVVAGVNEAGGDANSPQALKDMGLAPKFPPVGGATYEPVPGEEDVPTGLDALSEFVSFNKGGGGGAGDGNSGSLGAVFGASASISGGGGGFRISTRASVEGAGDKEWGYRSDYDSGPGFGGPGYGDLGGNGHGAGGGEEGERGHRDPNLFSFEGVADHKGAFARFNSPTGSSTVFDTRDPENRSRRGRSRTSRNARVRPQASTSGGSGGASFHVHGRPSPHTLVSVSGTLKSSAKAAGRAVASVGSLIPHPSVF